MRLRITLGLLAIGGLLAGMGGCSTTNKTEAACEPMEQLVCTCENGDEGVQICQEDGQTVTACDCSAGAGGTGGTAGGGTGGVGGSAAGAGGQGGVGGTGGDTGGTGGTAGGGGDGPTCDEYCTTVQQNCKDENKQWSLEVVCLNSCQAFEKGAITDTSVNTLGCRLRHAGLAFSDPDANCEKAGPTGGSQCGDPCEAYCTLMEHTCEFPIGGSFPTFGECIEACNLYPVVGTFNATTPAADSRECRTYHVGLASEAPDMGTPDVHCPHAGVTGAGVCVGPIPMQAGTGGAAGAAGAMGAN